MRLLIVSTWQPYPPDNGSRVRAYQLLRHFARQHRVTLLSFGVPRSPDDVAALRSFCGHVELVPPTPLRGNRLTARGLLSPVPRYFVQTESARMRTLVAAQIHRHDVAMAFQVNAALYLSGWPDVPRIFEEVEVGTYRDDPPAVAGALDRARRRVAWWKYRRFVRELVNSFDRSTVVSGTERDHLGEIGCNLARIAIVPNGTIVMGEPPRREHCGSRLVYPGPVMYSANLDAVRYFVREILPIIRRTRPDVTFVVTGATDGVDIRDLEAEDGVSFTGRLDAVDAILAKSAVCVVPLRTGGGTRLKVLQAMAIGTPVVSTRKGIEGLEVEPERHALVADESRAFAAQVLRLLSEPELGSSLSRNAHALVRERYDWEQIGATLERVVEGAVASHGSKGDARGIEAGR